MFSSKIQTARSDSFISTSILPPWLWSRVGEGLLIHAVFGRRRLVVSCRGVRSGVFEGPENWLRAVWAGEASLLSQPRDRLSKQLFPAQQQLQGSWTSSSILLDLGPKHAIDLQLTHRPGGLYRKKHDYIGKTDAKTIKSINHPAHLILWIHPIRQSPTPRARERGWWAGSYKT